MPAKTNLTTTADFSGVKAREIDFVTRFSETWKAFADIMGIMRPIAKAPGTRLTSYRASGTLVDGDVGEGEEIPYSKFGVESVSYADITLKKYAKAVSIEAVEKYGAAIAVQKTDNAFLKELQGGVLTEMFTMLDTGTLTGSEADLQMAVSMAIGKCKDRFEKARLDSTNIVVFINTLDFYRYLGGATLTLQTENGLTYLKNFLGAGTVIITSEIGEGKVYATPADNLILYYIDPSNSEFSQLGLNYTVEGETNLIGFHASGDYSHAVGESFAIMGMKMWAEYADGIAVISFGGGSGAGAQTASVQSEAAPAAKAGVKTTAAK